MDVDHEEQEDVVSRYAGAQHAGTAAIEEDEEEVPRNPLKYVYPSSPLDVTCSESVLKRTH